MKVHTYEKGFLAVGALLLVACAIALAYATLALRIHLPGHSPKIDPMKLATTPPFDKPGVFQTGPHSYDVVVVGQMWSFTPADITVPVDADITFIATSADVIHGFMVQNTRINMMLIPGQVARNTYRFRAPGEHLLICHEYCGLAHHSMFGKVTAQ